MQIPVAANQSLVILSSSKKHLGLPNNSPVCMDSKHTSLPKANGYKPATLKTSNILHLIVNISLH